MNKQDRYWENQSGIHDPIAKAIIEKENKREKRNRLVRKRNKEVHDIIQEIKNMLKDKDLILVERIKLEDKKTGKVYR